MQKGIDDFIIKIRSSNSFFYCQTVELNRATDALKDAVNNFVDKNGDKVLKAEVWDFEESEGNPDLAITGLHEKEVGTVMLARQSNFGRMI